MSLSKQSAASIKAKFHLYLDCAGVTGADALLFAGLNGTFDGAGYQLHFHGIIAGDKLAALEGMRGNLDLFRQRKFVSL